MKNYFNSKSVRALGAEVKAAHAAFDEKKFNKKVAAQLEQLELKDRVRLIAASYRECLPEAYPEALDILLKSMSEPLPSEDGIFESGFKYWPLAYFIEEYGLAHFQASVKGMYEVTQRFSAEFAIRPYLVDYQEDMLSILANWASDPNLHVRRLVSEGIRPRLPWGQRLYQFIEDPTPVFSLLERLKDDPELYVRRSVANNLNDLTKDHPNKVLDILERWAKSASKERQWIITHALRSLIKDGDKRALKLLGYGKADVDFSDFKISNSKIVLGEKLNFSFLIKNKSKSDQNLMIDFVIHFVKANGSRSPKVFKLNKKKLKAGEQLQIEKKHAIKAISTRAYYPGEQLLQIQINGEIVGEAEFGLEL